MASMRKRVIAMAASMALLASAVAPGASAAGSAGAPAGVTPDPVPLKTWYTQPAPQTAEGWEQQATPLGNGHIGAMVFGGVAGDKIQVNEKTIWSGGPGADPDYNYGIQTESADAKAALNELREILQKHATEFTETQKAHFDDNGNLITGNYSYGEDAARIAELEKQLYGDRSTYGSYQTLGDIYITDPSGNDSYTDYRRELDLRRGVATVSYRQDGVDYTREYFVSYPGNVMVMRLTASEKGALDRDITLDSIQPQKTVTGDIVNNTITMRGRPSDHDENGEEFVQQLKVTATGGSVVTIGSTSSAAPHTQRASPRPCPPIRSRTACGASCAKVTSVSRVRPSSTTVCLTVCPCAVTGSASASSIAAAFINARFMWFPPLPRCFFLPTIKTSGQM